jgi:hypothetical protein
MVAGTAAAFWGVVREQNGVSLTARQVREALVKHGTPQGSGGHIGPLPDLRAMLAAYGLPDGLWLAQDARLGKTAPLEVSGPAGAPWILLVAGARGRTTVPGLNRDILLDLKTMAGVRAGVLGAQGKDQVNLPVPNDPVLAEVDVYFQAVDHRAGQGFHATNSVEVSIAP